MFKKITATALSFAVAVAAMPATAATAQVWSDRAPRYEQSGFQQVGYRDDRGRRYNRGQNRGYNRGYRQANRRCYDKGNGGLAIGGIAGGLLGNQIAGGGDRTLGTILGAGVGALAGRAIDKSDGARC